MFQRDPDLDVCVTLVELFWDDGLKQEAQRLRHHERAHEVPGYATTAMLAKRQIFETVGVFNDDLWFADSVDWFLRARDIGCRVEVLQETLVYHRMHSTNLTRRFIDRSREEFLRIVKRNLDRSRSEDYRQD